MVVVRAMIWWGIRSLCRWSSSWGNTVALWRTAGGPRRKPVCSTGGRPWGPCCAQGVDDRRVSQVQAGECGQSGTIDDEILVSLELLKRSCDVTGPFREYMAASIYATITKQQTIAEKRQLRIRPYSRGS